jgi:hypothetical protein
MPLVERRQQVLCMPRTPFPLHTHITPPVVRHRSPRTPHFQRTPPTPRRLTVEEGPLWLSMPLTLTPRTGNDRAFPEAGSSCRFQGMRNHLSVITEISG